MGSGEERLPISRWRDERLFRWDSRISYFLARLWDPGPFLSPPPAAAEIQTAKQKRCQQTINPLKIIRLKREVPLYKNFLHDISQCICVCGEIRDIRYEEGGEEVRGKGCYQNDSSPANSQ